MNSFPWTPEQVIKAGKREGFPIWTNEYDLNFWGIRNTDDLQANTFNDWLVLFHYRNNGTTAFYAFQATTDPGTHYRHNPANAKGCAMLPPGHYKALFKRGKHKGRYAALVQNAPVAVWRDNDGDGILEPGNLAKPRMIGLNCHHAGALMSSTYVNKWSATCQVTAAEEDLRVILMLLDKQKKIHGYGTLSYGLLPSSAIRS